MHRHRLLLLAGLVVATGACAGDVPPSPVASEAGDALAQRAESMAAALEDERPCDADEIAQQLLGDARRRFEAGELSEAALAAIVDSVDSIAQDLTCEEAEPSPPADEPEPKDGGEGKDDDKEDDKKEDDKKDDEDDKDDKDDDKGRD